MSLKEHRELIEQFRYCYWSNNSPEIAKLLGISQSYASKLAQNLRLPLRLLKHHRREAAEKVVEKYYGGRALGQIATDLRKYTDLSVTQVVGLLRQSDVIQIPGVKMNNWEASTIRRFGKSEEVAYLLRRPYFEVQRYRTAANVRKADPIIEEDSAEAIVMRAQGKSFADIGHYHGVSVSCVKQRIATYKRRNANWRELLDGVETTC